MSRKFDNLLNNKKIVASKNWMFSKIVNLLKIIANISKFYFLIDRDRLDIYHSTR